MTSSRPYLLRAIYEWLVDNQLTPYLMVDAAVPDVQVPEQYIEDGQIILNIAPQAVADLVLGNRAVDFDAQFAGVPHHLHVPIMAVKAVYAFENGRGMVFGEGEDEGGIPPSDEPPQGGKPPHLKVVK